MFTSEGGDTYLYSPLHTMVAWKTERRRRKTAEKTQNFLRNELCVHHSYPATRQLRTAVPAKFGNDADDDVRQGCQHVLRPHVNICSLRYMATTRV